MGKLRKPQKVTCQTYDAILHDNDLHFNLFYLLLGVIYLIFNRKANVKRDQQTLSQYIECCFLSIIRDNHEKTTSQDS